MLRIEVQPEPESQNADEFVSSSSSPNPSSKPTPPSPFKQCIPPPPFKQASFNEEKASQHQNPVLHLLHESPMELTCIDAPATHDRKQRLAEAKIFSNNQHHLPQHPSGQGRQQSGPPSGTSTVAASSSAPSGAWVRAAEDGRSETYPCNTPANTQRDERLADPDPLIRLQQAHPKRNPPASMDPASGR
ncbi:hypothetical protein ACLOJK_007465 [Asimina triloba]